MTLTLNDLPVVGPNALAAIEALKGPTGANYVLLTDVTQRTGLWRYKMAMSVYLDMWVKRTDVKTVTKSLAEVLRAAKPSMYLLLLLLLLLLKQSCPANASVVSVKN